MRNTDRAVVRSVFLAILICQMIAGCSDNGAAIDPAVSQVSGSWIWVRSEGGFFPHVVTPPAGTIVKDFYSIEGEFFRQRNDTIVVSAHYTISRVGSGLLLTFTDITTIYNYYIPVIDEWLQIERDTLWLQDNGADLYRHSYVRARR